MLRLGTGCKSGETAIDLAAAGIEDGDDDEKQNCRLPELVL